MSTSANNIKQLCDEYLNINNNSLNSNNNNNVNEDHTNRILTKILK